MSLDKFVASFRKGGPADLAWAVGMCPMHQQAWKTIFKNKKDHSQFIMEYQKMQEGHLDWDGPTLEGVIRHLIRPVVQEEGAHLRNELETMITNLLYK